MICDSWLKSVQCCDYIFFLFVTSEYLLLTHHWDSRKKKSANTWFLTNDKVIVPNLSYIYAPLFDPYWLDQMQQMCKRYGSELFLVIYIVYKLLNCKMKIFLGLSNGRKGGQSPRKKKRNQNATFSFPIFPVCKKPESQEKSIVALEYLMMIAKREMDISNMKTVVVITWWRYSSHSSEVGFIVDHLTNNYCLQVLTKHAECYISLDNRKSIKSLGLKLAAVKKVKNSNDNFSMWKKEQDKNCGYLWVFFSRIYLTRIGSS